MKTKPKRREVWIACSDKCTSGYAFTEREGCTDYIGSLTLPGWKPVRFVEAPKARRRK